MKLWITGANGMLGTALQRACEQRGISFIATDRNQADIGSSSSIESFAQSKELDCVTHIVNCAAIAQIDLAEKNPSEAKAVNTQGPRELGKIAKERGLRILHFSTDLVFNGSDESTTHKESDIPNPRGVYALTKYEGEKALLETYPQACVIRTSWLFGSKGKTFLSNLFEKMKKETLLFVEAEQKGRATFLPDLIKTVFELLSCEGIYHFSNLGEMTRYEMALGWKDLAALRSFPLRCEKICPLTRKDFDPGNPRPLRCVLDTQKIEKILPSPIRHWKNTLEDCFQ